jgi:hypothetical protein
MRSQSYVISDYTVSAAPGAGGAPPAAGPVAPGPGAGAAPKGAPTPTPPAPRGR